MVFATCIPVRPSDLDQIVHHSNYGPWLEIGRTELFRQVGISYGSMEQRGVLLAMTELWMCCKPWSHSTYGDSVVILTTPEEISSATMGFRYEVRRVDSFVAPEGRLTDEHLVSIEEHSHLVVAAKSKHAFADRGANPLSLDQVEPEVYERLRDTFANLFDA